LCFETQINRVWKDM